MYKIRKNIILIFLFFGLILTSQSLSLTKAEENQIPMVTIISPNNGDIVSGTIMINGTASDPDGEVESVSIRISAGIGGLANGTNTWSFIWDTTKHNNGPATIIASSYDGYSRSNNYSINVIIDNDQQNNNLPPVSDAGGPYHQTNNNPINFDGSASYDPDGAIRTYFWDFGDKNTSTDMSPNHTYTAIGNFTVRLTVTDNEGETDSDITYAYITNIEENDTENNLEPIAILEQYYYRNIGIPLTLDASDSYDLDGEIISYLWDLSDGIQKSGITIDHVYNQIGEYNISLTITDNDNAVDTTYSTVIITAKLNHPPELVEFIGPTNGNTKISYNYSIIGLDPDNDNIKYIIDWNDGTNSTSKLLENSSIMNFNHTWSKHGVYNIDAKVIDENNATSSKIYLKIIIGMQFLNEIGYLYDENSDGIYDKFYDNNTGNTTSASFIENNYYIDLDSDQNFDYIYNPLTGETTTSDTSKSETTYSPFEGLLNLINEQKEFLWIAIILIVLILVTFILVKIKKKYTKHKNIYYIEEKKETVNETPIEKPEKIITDEQIDDLRKRVDGLLENKK